MPCGSLHMERAQAAAHVCDHYDHNSRHAVSLTHKQPCIHARLEAAASIVCQQGGTNGVTARCDRRSAADMATLHAVLGGKSLSQLTRLKAISISGDNYFSMESADGGWLTGLGRLTGLTSAKFYGFVDVRAKAGIPHILHETAAHWVHVLQSACCLGQQRCTTACWLQSRRACRMCVHSHDRSGSVLQMDFDTFKITVNAWSLSLKELKVQRSS
jgi:hypothetical protein